MLHMDVVQERLEREFNLDLITTAPSVTYRANLVDGTVKEVENPSEMPEVASLKSIEEPYVKATVMAPNDYVGAVMELYQRRRGQFVTMEYLDDYRVNVIYKMPLSEIIFDFFDKLKSNTKGYASLDYELDDYQQSDLVKIDILLNGDKVDALSFISHRQFAEKRGREIAVKLKGIIPRQNFEIPIQAAIALRWSLGPTSVLTGRTLPLRSILVILTVVRSCWISKSVGRNGWSRLGRWMSHRRRLWRFCKLMRMITVVNRRLWRSVFTVSYVKFGS